MKHKRAYYRVHDKVIYMSFKRTWAAPSSIEESTIPVHKNSAKIIPLALFQKRHHPIST